MNKIHRVVWNEVSATWVAVAEIVKARGKRGRVAINNRHSPLCRLVFTPLALALASIGLAQAAPGATELPTGGQVVAGSAGVSQSNAVMNINQTSNRAAIDWRTFNVGSQAQVNFHQPSTSSATLNRVNDANPSQIFGRITANGQVFLSNPNGVYFSPGASVDVGGLVATTHHISIDDFMAGKATFERNGATGSVINEGELKAALGGYIALLAPEVRNQGVIIAETGTVALASGEAISLHFGENGTLAGITATKSQIAALVENRNAVLAPGGLIILSAQAANALHGGVVNNSGILSASSLVSKGGRILLEGDDVQLTPTSRVEARGATQGGNIEIQAKTLAQAGTIDAGGASGGSVKIEVEQSAQLAGSISVRGDQGAGGDIVVKALAEPPESADPAPVQTEITGRLDASGATEGGKVQLSAPEKIEVSGGELDAGGETGNGGEITLVARKIALTEATLKADGETDGGHIALRGETPAAPIDHPLAPPATPPNVALSGNSLISASGRKGRGGRINLSGNDIDLEDSTQIVATGASGGGEVLVGGDWQGSGDLPQAIRVSMASDVTIDVSATDSGDGGKVVLWSAVTNPDSVTEAHGTILARGGVNGGDGGRIEASGHVIAIDGARIDTLSLQGHAGLWLIDPYNYTIDASAAAAIGTALNSSSVTVTTTVQNTTYGSSTNSGDAGDITLASNIQKTGTAGATTLTLKADTRVNMNGYSISSTGDPLNVVLWADSDGNGVGGVSAISNITTNGGFIWAGGGSSTTQKNSVDVPNGPSLGNAASNWHALDWTGQLNTSGGDVMLWSGTGNGDNYLYASTGTGINAGSGNITLRARDFNWLGVFPAFTTTGAITIQPDTDGGSFARTIQTGWFNIGGATPSSFQFGAPGNTSGMTIDSALYIAGPITVYGDDIRVSSALTTSGADILLKGRGFVWLDNAAADVTTNGGDFVMWSNSVNATSGLQNNETGLVDGSSITTNGGRIVLAGGLDNGSNGGVAGDGIPDGYAYRGYADTMGGVSLGTGSNVGSGITLSSGGGDILIRGEAGNQTGAVGVLSQGRFKIDSGTGTIILDGKSATGHGMELSYGAVADYVISSSSTSATTPAIRLTGTSSIAANDYIGLNLAGNTSGKYLIQSLGASGGGIELTGTNNTAASTYGIYSGATGYILSQSGDITLTGDGGTTLGRNIQLNGVVHLGAYLGAATTVNGVNVAPTSSDADITFDMGDGGASWTTGALEPRVNTTGHFSFLTSAYNFGTSWFTFGNTLGGLTVGKSTGNSGTIALDEALTVSGPVSVYGYDINVTAGLTESATATTDILLKASRHISLGGNITANSGLANVQLWADSDKSGDGINMVSAASIDTHGGWLKFGNNETATLGGNTVLVGGDVYFNGASAQTLTTGGGDLDIYGEGILANTAGLSINSGGGDVAFLGLINSGNGYTGVNYGSGLTWDSAFSLAKGSTGGGSATGDTYLATITSRLENAIAGLSVNYQPAWLGGRRVTGIGTDSLWRWVTGPEGSQDSGKGLPFFDGISGGTAYSGAYSNWNTGEPNNSGGEDRLQFVGSLGQWNDLSGTSTSPQYYVKETNLAPSPLTINAGSGTVTFDGAVGANKALATLTVTGATTLPVSVTTTGQQTYNSPVTLVQNTALASSGGDIVFNSTVDSDNAATPWNLTTTINPSTTYYWVDWTSSDTTHVYGTITIGADVINVTYSNANGYAFAQTSGGTNYWTGYVGAGFSGASPYVSPRVANGPTGSDLIALRFAGAQTLTFSQSVENLAFSVMSMNGNGYGFNQDFTITSYSGYNAGYGVAGPGYFGGGNMVKDTATPGVYKLNDGGVNGSSQGGASEPHGTIRFNNAFDSLTWNSLSNEYWNGFTVGVTGTSASAGTVRFNGVAGGTVALGAVTVNGALQTTANISDAASLSVSGRSALGGDITTSGNQSYASAVTVNSDVALTTSSNGNVGMTSTLDGAHTLTIQTHGTGDTTLSGAVGGTAALTGLTIDTDALSAAKIALAANSALDITNAGTSAISGVISGSGATLAKDGGGTLTLSGANTYSGGTTVSGGVLKLGVATTGGISNGPVGTGAVTVVSGGALDLAGFGLANALDISGTGVSNSGALFNSTGTAVTVSGATTLSADATIKSESGGNLTYSGTVDGAHALTVDTDGASSDATFTLSGIVGGSTPLTGVSIDSGTANTTLSALITAAGPISVQGGNIALNQNLTSTAAGADILLKASGNITLAVSKSVVTNAGDITFWADSDADTTNYGKIVLDAGSAINSNGGNVTLGGGSDIATGYATYKATGTGNASGSVDTAAETGAGIDIRNASISAGVGSVTMRGQSVGTPDDYSQGISIRGDNGASSVTGGTITLTGISNNAANSGGNGSSNRGISLVKTGTGSVSITGSGDVSLTGTGSAGIGGTGYNNRGVALFGASVGSTGGSVSITGTGRSTGSGNDGVLISSGSVSTAAGSLTLTGTGSGTSILGINLISATLGGSGQSGSVTLNGDALSVSGTSLTTTGTVTAQPISASFSSALTWPIAGLTLGGGVAGLTLGKEGNTADITISSAHTIAGPITVYGGNIAVNQNLTSTAAGADILLKGSGNITLAASKSVVTSAGDITFWADSDASGAGGINIQNNVTLDTRTAADRLAGNTSTASAGGKITLAGGLDDGGAASGTNGLITGLVSGDGLPDGYAIDYGGTYVQFGIMLGTQTNATGQNSNIAFYSGGGDIRLQAKVASVVGTGSNGPTGLMAYQGVNMDAGDSGDLTLVGVANVTTRYPTGMDLQAWRNASGTTSTFRTADGNLTLIGRTAGATQAGSVGLSAVANDNTRRIVFEATGTGSITFDGANSSAFSPSDIDLGTTDLLANSGTIDLIGRSSSIQFRNWPAANGIYLGYKAGTAVMAGSSDITITANAMTLSDAPHLQTSGAVTLEPFGGSFSSALSTGTLALSSDVSSLTIGKTTNTANITIGNATSIAGPIAIYGGDITLNAKLEATGGNTITLKGSGNVTDGASGYVSADKLVLTGSGNVTLDSSSNAIGTLAASGVGSLTYVDSNALEIGTVDTTDGVSASGAVSIATLTGDLTVSQGISTTNATASAIVLNAGKNAAAGTSTGGDIVISGSPTVSVGTGGTAKFLTGSLSGSTGLAALAGTGSESYYRYNADETTNFASGNWLNLGAGNYVIYRERPTVTIGIDDQTMTYGDADPAWTFAFSGGVNGDTYAQAFASNPTVSVGGAKSTANHYVAGTHTLSSSSSTASQLGYAVNGAVTDGTLTVNQKTLTYTGTVTGRAYDGTTTATMADAASGVAGGDLVSVTSTSATYADKNAGTGIAVSVSGIGLSNTDAANYSIASTAGVTGDITAKTVTLSASKTYDGTRDLTDFVTIATGVGSETLTYSGATASDAHVATASKYIDAIVLADASDASGGLVGNYQLPTLNDANAPVTITAKALTSTASIGGTLSKTYDGGTSASGATLSGDVSGAVSGDTISLDTSGYSLAYDNAHVGDASQISASGTAGFSIDVSALGSQASDYSFSGPTIAAVAASITPKTLTPTLSNSGVTKVYDGITDAPSGFVPTYTFNGLVIGDTAASLSYTGAAYNSKDVASANTVTVSGLAITGISGSNGSAASDYALDASSKDVAATITAKMLTVTGLVADDKIYDGTTGVAISDWGTVSTGIGAETLVLDHGSASFADADAGTGKSVTANGYSLADGSNGGLASNYLVGSATTTADIAKAPLTVRAQDDARFVTESDAVNFNGVLYDGFVNGETNAVLAGSVSVTRANSSTNAAGTYSGVLVPDGLSSNNYDITYANGNYTIVAANALLIRVSDSSTSYGTGANYSIGSARYLANDNNTIVDLSGNVSANGNNSFTISDGAGGAATFTLAPQSAVTTGAGKLAVGSYQLTTTGTVTENSQNFNDTITVLGAHTVTQKALAASASGVSKIYDGTTSMTGLGLELVGLETGDAVIASGSGAFSGKDVGSGLNYSISGITLGGSDAGNYHLTGGNSLVGNDGIITPRALNVSYGGVNKTYDGGTGATVTATDDRVAGDTLSISLNANFADKNVGTAKVVSVTGVSLGGADADNYTVDASASTTADITRLASVTWTGGATGNWFDPANWAGGAVPDLSNVAGVVIPSGVTVSFDMTGVVSPAQTGTVHIDSLGTLGNLSQSSGTLAIGSGGMTLNGYSQSGGALSSDGPIILDAFTQTNGSTTANGDFTVNTNYSQSAGGAVAVHGNARLADINGGMTLGNLTVDGTLYASSSDGNITQADGTAIKVDGASHLNATQGGSLADIALHGTGNDFVGPFNADGRNISVVDGHGGLILGNVHAGGDFDATSSGGDIGQSQGTRISVSGSSSFDAVTHDIDLTGANNNFAGVFNATGRDITVYGENSLQLGTVHSRGDLSVTAQGNLTQTSGGSLNVAGNTILTSNSGLVTLNSSGNAFAGGVVRIDNEVRNQATVVNIPPTVNAIPSASEASGLGETGEGQIVNAVGEAGGDGGSGGKSEGSATSTARSSYGTSEGLFLELVKPPTAQETGLIAVTVPKGTSSLGGGFSFPLPTRVVESASNGAPIQVSLSDGSPLPSWLKFDASQNRFFAVAVPDGALPIIVMVTIGNNRTLIVISERTTE